MTHRPRPTLTSDDHGYAGVGGRFFFSPVASIGDLSTPAASVNLVPPTRPHPSSVERRSRGKWVQTAPQEPKCRVWPVTHRGRCSERPPLRPPTSVSVGKKREPTNALSPHTAHIHMSARNSGGDSHVAKHAAGVTFRTLHSVTETHTHDVERPREWREPGHTHTRRSPHAVTLSFLEDRRSTPRAYSAPS